MFEIVGALIGIGAAVVFGIDYFFDTHIVDQVAHKSAIIGALLDKWRDQIEYVPVDDNDPFYLELQRNLWEIMIAESIKMIKVQEISDIKKTFVLTSFSGDIVSVMISQSWNNFIVKKSTK